MRLLFYNADSDNYLMVQEGKWAIYSTDEKDYDWYHWNGGLAEELVWADLNGYKQITMKNYIAKLQ